MSQLWNDFFGWSVAISGDKVVVGARLAANVGEKYAGSAYIFRSNGGKWQQIEKLNSSRDSDDQKGFAVGIKGDTVIVGLSGKDISNSKGNFPSGAAYIFETEVI